MVGYKTKNNLINICNSINFEIQKGELVSIIGANGVGKSTLLRTLANIQPELEGEILLNNKNIHQYKSIEFAENASLVLTEPIAAKNLTVIETISLGRQPYTNWIGTLTRSDKLKIKEALSLMSLTDLKNKKCYELSDGQLQRVMIARALAQDTSLIILDEPTTHLDIYHKASILKLLKKIAHTMNKTILFSSHEIDLAIQLCDKMLIINNNTSIFGQPCELIANKSFDNLFPSDLINFDANSGTFKLR
ncbi:ABC transporter ATP-binding protein [Abyssalbus ytuae]|uniref:ABC transporter ATP-binding protein n=1 Tax=Abyssalbus ytuae TaxID=2926907 RepID=A0A9E7CTK3_9FLAO|nr:ABC transporter ATP-binding protein [Abyssalbus ytuae]UOB18221.1 ABC transporter ATP-binding protein [Abyssalbus ytuae]